MAIALSRREELLGAQSRVAMSANVPSPTQKDWYSCTRSADPFCEEHKAKCPSGSLVGKSPSPVIDQLLHNLPWMCKYYKTE